MSSDQDCNIYYNLRSNNKVGEFTQITYNETRVTPILKNPYKYELAVERFRIPLASMPIFIWPTTPFTVKFVYLGNEFDQDLVYTLMQFPTGFYGDAVWDIRQFVDLVNTALANGFAALKAAFAGAAPTEAPYMTYDATTELFTWNIEVAYEGDTKVYFNNQLYRLFTGFKKIVDNFAGTPWNEMVAQNVKNNTVTILGTPYYSTPSEYITIQNWNDLQTVTFQSDLIPLLSENLPGQKNEIRAVITDFEPLSSVNNRQALQYFPSGPLRYYNMLSTTALSSIDLKVYWEDRQGKEWPFYVGSGDYWSLKLLFRKRA